MEFVYLILGLGGLIISSNLVIRGARNLANFLYVSELFIGLTFVAIGTSLPEIAVNIASGINNLKGIESSGVAVGNIIGASLNLFTLILGGVTLLGCVYASQKNLMRDGLTLLFAVLIFFVMAFDLRITRIEGIVLVLFFLFYIYNLRHDEVLDRKPKKRRKPVHVLLDILLLTGGIALIIYSSNTVVNSSLSISEYFNIPKTFIGIFIIGLGTSLPELSIALFGAIKKAHLLYVGTLMGSVVCNTLLALGSGAILNGFNVDKNLLYFDIPYLFFTILLAFLFLRRKERLEKTEGIVLISVYLIYLVVKITNIL